MADLNKNSTGERKPSVYTKGETERSSKEQSVKTEKTLGEIKRETKHANDILSRELLGSYKKTITDAYISTFANNYDDAVDYYSLLDSFSFSAKNSSGQIAPSFKFNTNHVQFIRDAKVEHIPFNENSIDDFITNDDMIEGNYTNNLMEDRQEQEGFSKNKDYNLQEQKKDGLFCPTEDKRRYSTFNRINKLGGYMPPEESAKLSAKQAQKIWKQQEPKIVNNIKKKFKI